MLECRSVDRDDRNLANKKEVDYELGKEKDSERTNLW